MMRGVVAAVINSLEDDVRAVRRIARVPLSVVGNERRLDWRWAIPDAGCADEHGALVVNLGSSCFAPRRPNVGSSRERVLHGDGRVIAIDGEVFIARRIGNIGSWARSSWAVNGLG
jgi:hypothetical protein